MLHVIYTRALSIPCDVTRLPPTRTEALKERGERAHEVAERQVVVRNDALNLVEFSQMRCVQRLVAKDAVDGEVLDRFEGFLRRGWFR